MTKLLANGAASDQANAQASTGIRYTVATCLEGDSRLVSFSCSLTSAQIFRNGKLFHSYEQGCCAVTKLRILTTRGQYHLAPQPASTITVNGGIVDGVTNDVTKQVYMSWAVARGAACRHEH